MLVVDKTPRPVDSHKLAEWFAQAQAARNSRIPSAIGNIVTTPAAAFVPVLAQVSLNDEVVRGDVELTILSAGPTVVIGDKFLVYPVRRHNNRLQLEIVVQESFSGGHSRIPYVPLAEVPLPSMPPGRYDLQVVWRWQGQERASPLRQSLHFRVLDK
jgi:hypothetical protein